MGHLDEGQLHAYLDGEPADRPGVERHLAECADCRARIEAERRLRDRARAILGAAGPRDTAAPPFGEILRRAHGGERRARTSVTVVLAWAASLAVAITAGWYARGLLVTGHAAPPATQLARAPTVEARVPAQLAQAQPQAQVANARRAGAAPRGPATASVDTQQPSSTVVAAATPEAGVAGAVGEQADVGRAEAANAEKGAAAPEPVAANAAPKAAAARTAAPTVHLDEVVVTGAAAAPPAWTTVSRPAAEERLGGRIATIPDLPLLGHAVSGAGPNTVVRTIQVLGPGTTIELYQRRAGTRSRARALASAERTGVASLTVDWQGYSVTGTAAVPADSLRKLLARLRVPR